MKAWELAIIVCVLLCGCNKKSEAELQQEQRQSESPTERGWRWEQEAPAAVAAACSNYVGFRRLMNAHYVDTHNSPNPAKWTSTADVEFINKVGGVEVTNLPIRFGETGGNIWAMVDYDAIWEQEMKDTDAKIKEIQQDSVSLDRDVDVSGIQAGEPYTWTYKAGGKVTGVFDSKDGNNLVIKSGGQKLLVRVDLLIDEDQKIAGLLVSP